jgi:hypothetical protein
VNKVYSVVPSDGNGDLVHTRATSATRVNGSGIIENIASGVPRLDYSNSLTAPSWLLEPQRTNLLLNSVWAGSSQIPTSWSITGGGVSTRITSIKNPNVGAYNFISTSVNRVFFYQTQTFTINTSTSFSVYVEEALVPIQVQYLLDVVNATGTKTYLKNNVSINASEVIQQGNIYTIVFVATATTTGSEVRAGIHNSGTVGNVTLSMPQLELGAYPTSYIPTTTIVTRNGDLISKTGIGSDILNPLEGTFYIEFSASANDLIQKTIQISDGSDLNLVMISAYTISNVIRFIIIGSSATYSLNVTVSDITSFNKCLLKWGVGGLFAYVNGVKYTLPLSNGIGSGIPTALTRLYFSQWWGGTPFYGKCKGLQVYKIALTDAECASLTTL